MRKFLILLIVLAITTFCATVQAEPPAFKILAFYSNTVEKAHIQFAHLAIAFYTKLAADKNFTFDTTTDWSKLNADTLANYQAIVWLDDVPHNAEQRAAFQTYMEHGGGWLGCHFAGYNDAHTAWPWFVQFFGGAVFYTNCWPPQPAKLIVDDNHHPATQDLPPTYQAPANEFYQWIPSPRLNKNVRVLVTLDPSNYPLGKKDLLTEGDIPVVWTNTSYKMIYINMGHGDKILTDDTQNKLFTNALMWLGTTQWTAPAAAPTH
jgi:type 1 glutamine amidotransferase